MTPPPAASLSIARMIDVPARWCVHGYYTLCPYAPDGSGRLLLAGADVEANRAEVLVVGPEDEGGGASLIGEPVEPPASFWHTGLWQSWGPDSRFIYHQTGSLQRPRSMRRDTETGRATVVNDDLEGMAPSGEPGITGAHGLLYAAGFSHKQYRPEETPVPFQARDRHGLSRVSFEPPCSTLALTTAEVLDRHPDRDRLLAADRDARARFGTDDGLTLMCYCVRWNAQGTRLLFYFGNHCVARDEPRIAYVFTADRDLREIRLAVNLAFDRRGVHWGWHPDGEHVMGYGPNPAGEGLCIAIVHHSGENYRKLATHASGGHPNVSPTDHDLLVTDAGDRVAFIDLRSDRLVAAGDLPRKEPDAAPGRHPGVIDHHPVFRPDGQRVLINTLQGSRGVPVELVPPTLK